MTEEERQKAERDAANKKAFMEQRKAMMAKAKAKKAAQQQG